jgi:asparagine synthase (glutamine-hydrolysing)
MCGINGIFAYHERAALPSRDALVRTRDHMARRGPDGTGEWCSANQRLRLAHRRLSIIDIGERADQPLISQDQRFAIVFNGEIYNYRQLRERLITQGVMFKTESDTEVIVELFRRDGVAAFDQLRGMFALAIYDTHSDQLTLARDPYGIKPLYIADDGQSLHFASSCKALVASGVISAEVSAAAEVGLLLFGHVPEPHSWYDAIRALSPGHYLVLGDGQKTLKSFCSLQSLYLAPANLDQRDLILQTQDALRDSLRAHLVADVPVGLFLSAGVDSGALLGMMRDVSSAPILATTLQFAEFANKANDEAPLAAMVAKHYGADHAIVTVDEADFQRDLNDFFAQQDQPTLDGINTWLVSKAAAARGLKVAISGVGGDELFAGYPSFRELPSWRKRLRVPAAIPGFGRLIRQCMQAFGGLGLHPKASGMIELANSWAGLFLLRRGVFMPWELHRFMSPDRLAQGLAQLAWQAAIEALTDDRLSDIAQVGLMESSLYMRNQLLRDTDWASMAHSVEVRTPLVDAQLLRSLGPQVARFAAGDGKRMMAAAPQTALPSAIVDRPKTGFTTPVADWIAKHPDYQRWHAKLARNSHWSRPYTLTVGTIAGASWR